MGGERGKERERERGRGRERDKKRGRSVKKVSMENDRYRPCTR